MAVFAAVVNQVTEVSPSLLSSVAQGSLASGRADYLKPPVVLSTVPGILARHQAEAQAIAPPLTATPTGAATPDAQALASNAPPSPEPQQATITYTIQPGDTVSSIAAKYGIDADYIRWNNSEISADPDLLIVGETLLIPSVNGLVYHVTLGDTLSDIASYYQIDVQSITAFLPNAVPSADKVSEGMVLLLPGAVPPPPPIPAAVDIASGPPASAGGSGAVPAGNPAASSGGYSWPFYGGISTYFGEPRGDGYHKGIDIDGFNAYGTPIGAAAGGTVVLAAWDDWGLGYHVIVDHGDGSRTVYGHLSEIWVSQGQYVSQGEAVGALGSSGYSTGPHLHFELWVGGGPVDPLAYLP